MRSTLDLIEAFNRKVKCDEKKSCPKIQGFSDIILMFISPALVKNV